MDATLRPDQRTPEAVVQRQLDAYNGRDIDEFVACYSDHARLRPLVVRRPTLRDRASAARLRVRGASARELIREIYGRLFDDSPALHAEVIARIVRGDFVIDHERVTGQNRSSFDIVAIYEVRNGLIMQVWFIE